MRFAYFFYVSIVSLVVTGCASQLKPLPPGSEPNTTLANKGFEVSYSAVRQKLVDLNGILISIRIKNLSNETVKAIPEVYLLDSARELVGMPSLETVLSYASRRANVPIPDSFYTAPGGYYSIKATATDMATGKRYDVEGTARPSAFASGFSQGVAIAAAMDRNEADRVLTWASANWLRETYTLPPGVSVVGEVFMPFFSRPIPKGNTVLEVSIGGKTTDIGTPTLSYIVPDRALMKFNVPAGKFE